MRHSLSDSLRELRGLKLPLFVQPALMSSMALWACLSFEAVIPQISSAQTVGQTLHLHWAGPDHSSLGTICLTDPNVLGTCQSIGGFGQLAADYDVTRQVDPSGYQFWNITNFQVALFIEDPTASAIRDAFQMGESAEQAFSYIVSVQFIGSDSAMQNTTITPTDIQRITCKPFSYNPATEVAFASCVQDFVGLAFYGATPMFQVGATAFPPATLGSGAFTTDSQGWHTVAYRNGPIKNASQNVAANVDGRLELFGIGTDGAVWHNYQVAAGAGWSGWSSLGTCCGGGWLTPPVVGVNQDGRLEIFQVGADHALWHFWQEAAGTGPWNLASLGGWVGTTPAVATNADGRLEVFVIGSDGAVYHNYQLTSGGWSGWSTFGICCGPGNAASGGWLTPPIVGINQDGRLELFEVGPDHALWHLWQTSPSSSNSWQGGSLGGWIGATPAVATNADGRLEVFVIGSDGGVYHNYQVAANSGWSGWSGFGTCCGPGDPVSGAWQTAPIVGINKDGRLELFEIGPDHAMWHLWETSPSSSTSWQGASLGGGFENITATVTTNSDGRLEVFGIGTDHAPWHAWQLASGGWSGWYSLGGQLVAM